MSERNKRWFRRAGFVLLISLTVMACGMGDSVTDSVMGDSTVEIAISEPGLVETAVAQTVEASTSIEQPATDPNIPDAPVVPVDPNAPDLVDPNSGVEALKPTADPSSGTPQLKVIYSSVNVRNGPGTNYRPISALLQDSVVPVIAKNPAGTWFLIELPGGSRGWVADSVTDPVDAAAMVNVPIAATIPAPPAPTATATSTSTPVPTNTATATATTLATATSTTQATATPTSTTQAPASSIITVVNNSTIDVCFVFIDLVTDPWTVDRLGPNEIILPGAQRTFTFPNGEYDMKAEDCNNGFMDDLFGQTINGPFTWVIN